MIREKHPGNLTLATFIFNTIAISKKSTT